MRVLFVCSGNLCRSPFAEHLYRKMSARVGAVADSAGTLAVEGDPSPDPIVRVARSFGVDLSRHRARPLARSSALLADRILVMESRHADAVRGVVPERSAAVSLLGALDGGPVEVADPYGEDDTSIHETLERIARCLEILLAREAK